MKKIMAMGVIVCALAGCSPELIEDFRVGERFDAAAFARATGIREPDTVVRRWANFSYDEYPFTVEGVDYAVRVSKKGMIVGTWASLPCKEADCRDRIAAIKAQMMKLYADKLECCGAAKSEVEIRIQHAPKAQRITVYCRSARLGDLKK